MNPRVAVVVLNWNGKRFLRTCLDSLFRQTYRNFYVIFVDNSSKDGSVNFVTKKYSIEIRKKQLKIVTNDKNYGYAEGNNIGMRAALVDKKTRYVAILNNDTEVHASWLSELVKTSEKSKSIGTVASKTIVFSNRNIIDTAGVVVYSDCVPTGRGSGEPVANYDTEEEIFGAYGAAAFYRREMLEDTRLGADFFDSDHFTYQEEFDLSWRAALRGWKCVFAPRAVVYHVGSATGRKMPKRVKYLLERNRIFAVVKNMQPRLFWYCAPRMILYELVSLPLYMTNGHLLAVLKGRLDGVMARKKFLKKREYIQSRTKISPEQMRRVMVDRNYAESLLHNV
jgi:hypothetical protein